MLKLEAILAILTFLSMGLTTETADINQILRQTLGYMIIAIIGNAILYVIVIGLYLMLYFTVEEALHSLNDKGLWSNYNSRRPDTKLGTTEY